MSVKFSPYVLLDERRKRLGMSRAILARRARVSQPTVTRILTGKESAPYLSNVQAIAAALGVSLIVGANFSVVEDVDVNDFRRRQALEKARRLNSMIQGTMGLESQAVDERALEEMLKRTVQDLLAGSRRRLWED
jgi:transcriptional regulator with XRE-family HTH domain